MNRQEFSTTLIGAATMSLLAGAPKAQAAVPAVRNVVLVHGLYADGSSWSEVIPRLQASGIRVTAVQNPLTSFENDVMATRRAIEMQDGPTVLAAHSYGGMVATEAGVDPKITGLVYVAARAPDAGENYTALTKEYPAAPAGKGLVNFGGYLMLSEDAFLNDFANGVDPVKARVLYSVQQPNVATLSSSAKTTVAAWRSKPSWYAVSKQDRTIDPNLERFMAKRMKARTIEVDSGHLSLVSHPEVVANLILTAAGHSTG